MAKDGTYRGGARIGAGRPHKPLEEKVADGDIKVDETDTYLPEPIEELTPEEMPPIDEYLTANQRNGKPLGAKEIYISIFKWVKSLGCEKKVSLKLLEQYAMDRARWIQCENAISEYGFLGKHPTTGAAMQSPYVEMLLKFEKAMNSTYFLIRQEVREYCMSGFIEYTPEDAIYNDILD